jgi:hypothetical protein
MLLAKVALAMGGTIVAAGAYTFHDGVLRVQVDDEAGGRHVHFWAPAAIVPMAMHVVPRYHFDHIPPEARRLMPTLRALSKELEKYPNAEFVEVGGISRDQHVNIRTQDRRLVIDVEQPGESVHIACPLAMVRDVADVLEANVPAV